MKNLQNNKSNVPTDESVKLKNVFKNPKEDFILEITTCRKNKKAEPVYIDNDFFRYDITELSKRELLMFAGLNYFFNKLPEGQLEARIDKNLFIKNFLQKDYKQNLTNKEKNELLRKAADKITSFKLIQRSEKQTAYYVIFTNFIIDYDKPYMEIKMNKDYRDLFAWRYENNFTIYDFKQLELFQSKYEQKLYLYLSQYKGQRIIKVNPDELKRRLGFKQNETASHIKRTLDKSIKDFKKYNIFETISYNIEYYENYSKEGYKKAIKQYVFNLENNKSTEQKEENKNNPWSIQGAFNQDLKDNKLEDWQDYQNLNLSAADIEEYEAAKQYNLEQIKKFES